LYVGLITDHAVRVSPGLARPVGLEVTPIAVLRRDSVTQPTDPRCRVRYGRGLRVPRTGLKSKVRRPIDSLIDSIDERSALREKTSPSTKAAVRSLWQEYRRRAQAGEPLPDIWDVGFRIFSEFDEDGITVFLLACAAAGTRRFVDIGADNGTHASNTANLALNLGFDGLFIEANAERLSEGERFYRRHPDTRERPPKFVNAFATAEGINQIVGDAGFEGEVDVLSIDIDGNDYWIWDSLVQVKPRVVVIEAHTEFGVEDVVTPYEPLFDWRNLPAGATLGASVTATTNLADRLGYRLVGTNLYGFNMFFLRKDLGETRIPTIEPGDCFRHASYLRDATFAGI
jgi:hypothetical protein